MNDRTRKATANNREVKSSEELIENLEARLRKQMTLVELRGREVIPVPDFPITFSAFTGMTASLLQRMTWKVSVAEGAYFAVEVPKKESPGMQYFLEQIHIQSGNPGSDYYSIPLSVVSHLTDEAAGYGSSFVGSLRSDIEKLCKEMFTRSLSYDEFDLAYQKQDKTSLTLFVHDPVVDRYHLLTLGNRIDTAEVFATHLEYQAELSNRREVIKGMPLDSYGERLLTPIVQQHPCEKYGAEPNDLLSMTKVALLDVLDINQRNQRKNSRQDITLPRRVIPEPVLI
jgi:hypothetical protein